MLTYWLLYRFSARLEAGKSAWWVGLIAWLLAGFIARLLSTNMTLMLRPEVWRDMYSASAAGAYLPTGDPTLTPRWLLMMAGGLFIGGLWMVYLAGRSHLHRGGKEVRRRPRRQGGRGLRHRLSRRRPLGRRRAAGSRQGRPGRPRGLSASTSSAASPDTAGWRWLSVAVLLAAFAGFGKIAAGWLRLGCASRRRADRDHVHRLPRRRARPDPAQQGLRRLGSRGRHQLERRRPLPGPLCRRPGRHWMARVRSGARTKK